ncbi:hypothetical protein BDD21_3936 [Thiocapsa rosea]|uniref:Uncharacterized protein n=1 Tax=Thiocapsa rosea TaxID=69360 RepID=A0A495VCR9_9GAMM|nr:hypothetical protein BDD21_3936 [Thiocapsa rosea]
MWNERNADTDVAYGTSPHGVLIEQAGCVTEGSARRLARHTGRDAIWLAARADAVTVDARWAGLR